MKKVYRYLAMSALAFAISLAIALVASAAPARSGIQDFEQPTGQKFKGELKGDEWLNWVETDQDEVVVRDKQGYWSYAEIVLDQLKPSGRKARIDAKPKNALTGNDMKRNGDKLHEKAEKNKNPSGSLASGASGENSQQSSEAAPAIASSSPLRTTGTQKVLVLLVQFTNATIQYSDNEWSDTFFETSGKTVRNFYRSTSNNRLDFVPAEETSGTSDDGVIKVSLNVPHSAGMVKEALTAADAYIDFASFDTNGDGGIGNDELHVVTILAGYEASYSSQLPNVWGHKTNLAGDAVPTLDGKRLCDYVYNGGYTQQGEIQGDHRATIGILAHELGHMLGLPDLYTNGSYVGIGTHSLMANGSWGSVAGEYLGATPVQLDAWCKVTLGFVDPIVVDSSMSTPYSVKSASTGEYNVLKLPTSNPNQYFLVENRQKEGYDAGLSVASGGIAIWHIDSNKPLDLEEETYGMYDPYYRAGYKTEFNPTSNPSSGRNDWSGEKYTGINISVASASAPAMTVNAYGDYTPPSKPDGLVSTYAVMSAIGLAWNASADSSGIDSYIVNRDGVKYDTTSSIRYKMPATANQTNSYTIQAVDKSGNLSAPSDPITVTTPSSNSVTIYYKRGFATPNILYKLDVTAQWSEAPMTQSEYPAYSKTTVDTGGSYSGLVAAFGDGQGTVDDKEGRNYYFEPGIITFAAGTYTQDFPVVDTQPPTAPTGLATTGKTDTTVSLFWTAAEDNVGVAGYDVYQDGQFIGTTAVTSFAVTGLTANTAYVFTVKAQDAEGNVSSASNAVSVTTGAPGNYAVIYYKQGFTTPYIHYNLNGIWTAVPGVPMPASEVAGYNKYTINIGSATQLEACFNNGSGTWDSRGGLNYLFPVGTSTFDAGTITSGAPDFQAPTAPTGLVSTGKTDTTVSLAWNASSDNIGVVGYDVYREGQLVGTTAAASYMVTGLPPSTSAMYSVKAKDAKGNVSSASNAISVTTAAGNGNTATIYYKRGFAAPFIHYQVDGGSWTIAPGVAMQNSEFGGYSKITINLGSATGLSAVFNDGNGTWDNNNGQNYRFAAGVSTFANGTIISGEPQPDSLTIVLAVPANTPATADVYMASSLGNWDAANASYKLTKQADGTYQITLPFSAGTSFEFKFTRGAWSSVEANADGSDISNRTYTTSGGAQTIDLTAQRWKDL
ncbi:carbohydrate binding domain-containing protein [Cohnella suwonensis]|uniref:Carbohydrate binding domain-containing protein n=1 Tax=Cohnella suwonensis TaxID=696072 RepID=A0ABW0LTB4_9BACL